MVDKDYPSATSVGHARVQVQHLPTHPLLLPLGEVETNLVPREADVVGASTTTTMSTTATRTMSKTMTTDEDDDYEH